MKNFILIFATLLFTNLVIGQNAQKQLVEENDPEATAVFQKVRAKYEAFASVKADISTIIEVPEQPKIEQKGTLILKGEQYHLDFPDLTYLSDGKNLWVHYKDKKMVQLNSIEEDDESLMTPKDLFRIYERDDFIYVLANEYFQNKRTIQHIELKPTDRSAEYAKLRVNIDKKTSEILSIKVFFTDGIRYEIKIDKLTPNPSEKVVFAFDKSKFPDVKVEDLRID